MGANFYSICHSCKVYLFHYRREEKLHEFYKAHNECGKKHHRNLHTTWDYFDDKALEYAQDNYKDVTDKYYPEKVK